MLSQFTTQLGKRTLADLDFHFPKDVYPVGRLDEDSEGILLLTNDKALNHRLLNPAFRHHRTYWAQVDGDVSGVAIEKLSKGVEINIDGKIYKTQPAVCKKIDAPENLPPRDPPVRYRKSIPTSWIELSLTEGKNRQVRKMTAAVGFPTLRLLRIAIEKLSLKEFTPGTVAEYTAQDIYRLLNVKHTSF